MTQNNITIQTRSSEILHDNWKDGMVKTTASQVIEETNRKFVTGTEKTKIQSLPHNIDGIPLNGQSNLVRLYITGDPNNSITKNLISINGENNIPLIEDGTNIYVFMSNGHKQSSMILKFDGGASYPVKYFGDTNSVILESIKPNTIIELEFYTNSWNIIGSLDHTSVINSKVTANNPIVAGSGAKITYDEKGLVTGKGLLLESDIPTLSIDKISDLQLILDNIINSDRTDEILDLINTKITANSNIVPGTATKVSYDNKGLVTGGSSLNEADLPSISINKVVSLQNALDNKTEKNVPIIPGTATKVSYDAKGLVTGGTSIIESDLPPINISKINNLSTILDSKINGNAPIIASTATKVSYDNKGLVTGGSLLMASDIPEIPISKVAGLNDALSSAGSADSITQLQIQMNNKVDKNALIAAGTGTKITYDAKGLVTGSTPLVISDIPQLTIGKINDLQTAIDSKLSKNIPVVAGTATKVSYDTNGLIVGKSSLDINDIPSLPISRINNLQIELNAKATNTDMNQLSNNLQTMVNGRVAANQAIVAGTSAKITYDEKGLVTAGSDLLESDIPTISISKVDGLQIELDSKAKTCHTSSDATYGISSAHEYGHAMAGNVIMPPGVAYVGTDDGRYARADHVHPSESGDATSVNGFTLDQDVTTQGSPKFKLLSAENIESEYDIIISGDGDFISPNNHGYMSKLTDDHAIKILYVDTNNNLRVGFNDIPIIINATDVKLSNNRQLATINDIPSIPTSLPANGGNANTVNGFTLDQDVTTQSSPKFNSIESDSTIKSRNGIEITHGGNFIAPQDYGYMVTHSGNKLNAISLIDNMIEIGDGQFPIKFKSNIVRLGSGGRIATIDDIPEALPAYGGNSDTVNGFTVESNVPENAVFTDTIYNVVSNNNNGLVPKEWIFQDRSAISATRVIHEYSQEPIEDIVTSMKYDINKHNSIKSVTIGTAWTGSSPPYTQTISVPGIMATDIPIISPVYSTTLSMAIAQKEAWGQIGKITTQNDSITVTCFEEKPSTAIPIQLKGV